MSKTFVIAEVGSCHDGNPGKALRLIEAARWAGADAVKFQFWSSAERLASRRRAAEYLDVYAQYRMPPEWFDTLPPASHSLGLEFMCTAYLPEDVAVVAPNVSRFKVASFEATDRDFLSYHEGFGKPVYVSTGMADEATTVGIARDVSGLRCWGSALLHCVSSYPCPVDQVNLRALRGLATWSDLRIGYSDHTTSPLTGALAVACGAEIVEFHLRLNDTDRQNPDYGHARAPGWARVYVSNIRQAEAMLGSGVKRQMPAEAEMARYRVGVAHVGNDPV